MKNLIKNLWFAGLLFLLFSTPAHAAKMALSPGSAEFRSGCVNVLNVVLNTEGENTVAVDAFLRYNPAEIEILDQLSGVLGVQIRPGSLYQSYPGNIVSNGLIRLTAFNQSGFFNGRGILASIVFKSKPGVESASLGFDFSPGLSTDSNVASSEASDLLNATYGGSYTFKPGPCKADTSPPWVEERSPDDGEVNVPLNSNIEFVIKDNKSGVDLDSLKVEVNDVIYKKEGENQFGYKGKALKYKITVDPAEDFLDRVPVVVKINAQDFDGNVMPEVAYSFNEVIPVEECECAPCPEELRPAPCPEPLRPAAPPDYSKFIIALLILLLLSVLYNFRLYLGLEKCKRRKFFKSSFIKRRIKKR